MKIKLLFSLILVTLTICSFKSYSQVTANAGADQSICIGSSATLTANQGTGYTYSWSTKETTRQITVTPQGTMTYFLTVTSGNQSATDNVVVTVNPLPQIYAGEDTIICYGTVASLHASGAKTYSWEPDYKLNSTIVSNPLTSTDSSLYYWVTGIDENGCKGIADSIFVYVLPSPVAYAGGNQNVCKGELLNLNAQGDLNYTYKWSPSTGLNATDSSHVVAMITATTTYTVVVTDGDGCTASDKMVATVNQLPTVNAGPNQTICNSQSVTLTANGSSIYGGVKYAWSNYSEQQTIVDTPRVTTTYIVTVMDTIPGRGCMNNDTVIVFYGACSDISQLSISNNNNTFDIYPNPSTGTFNISYSLDFETPVKIDIYNMLGEKIINLKNITEQQGKNSLVFNVPKGIYLVRFETKNNVSFRKIISAGN
ncbi:MAG: T9SS type A sorting domain-containing protein [Bacteroidota bacterium]|nr:T9SS type A sorting domain-containing protein [Bacteroidota bacterium]